MDLLEASKEAIEKALYFRLADLLNLDVELIFYDTTSVHFESDEGDEGSGEGDEVGGGVCSGAKTYRAPRKRGKSKKGRDDAPQIVVGLAVTREGFPVRHWVFPGNTVDVTTVAKVQAELKDWRLVCSRRGCGDGLGEESQGVECEWGPLHRVHAHPPRRGGRPGGLEPPWTLSGGRREPARQGSRGRRGRTASALYRLPQPSGGGASTRPSRARARHARSGAREPPSSRGRSAQQASVRATSSSPPPASPSSTRPKSRPPSAWTASSSCTATTTPSAPRTWRGATSSCSGWRRPGVCSRAACVYARSSIGQSIGSRPTSCSACSPSYSSAWPSTPAPTPGVTSAMTSSV